MAFAGTQPSLQERREPASIGINLSSNNPFRRAASPQVQSPGTPPNADMGLGQVRKQSTNPFLDDYKTDAATRPSRPRPQSPLKNSVPAQGDMSGTMKQLEGLSMGDNNTRQPNSKALPRAPMPLAPTANGMQPQPMQPSGDPSQARRPISEEERRRRMQARGAPPTKPSNIFNELDRSENRRPRVRRNSDSSVMDIKSVEDEEKARRERRRLRAEREGGERAGEGKRSERSRRPNKRLDLIDRLDLTGISGGASFHHDGPFDACNPHRNRKGRPHAPMQAFPEGSANNALGGSGPVNKVLDYDHYHGRQDSAFADFSNVVSQQQLQQQQRFENARPKYSQRTESFNAKDKVEQVHGDQTMGLGTSTFLEGAPASRSALQRRQSDGDDQQPGGQGLQRKKSLAQKIRGGIRPRPSERPAGYGEASRVVSPDAWPRTPPTPPAGVQSAGPRSKTDEINPFFSDGKTEATKAAVEVSESKVPAVAARSRTFSELDDSNNNNNNDNSTSRVRATSSPYRGNNRGQRSSQSSDDYGVPAGHSSKPSSSGAGFLNRVKSIKGKKSRAERSAS